MVYPSWYHSHSCRKYELYNEICGETLRRAEHKVYWGALDVKDSSLFKTKRSVVP